MLRSCTVILRFKSGSRNLQGLASICYKLLQIAESCWNPNLLSSEPFTPDGIVNELTTSRKGPSRRVGSFGSRARDGIERPGRQDISEPNAMEHLGADTV
jgi:hypothetical protein